MPARDTRAAARSAARSRALRAGARRARAAAHGRVPSPCEGSLSTNRRFLSSAEGGVRGGEPRCQVDVQENKSGDAEDAWSGRRSGNRPSSGALLLSRLELPPRARARGEPGPLGLPAWTETGFQAAPGSVRAAPELQDPSARHLRLRNGPGPAPD